MKDQLYVNELFDYYGTLFTEKQQEYFVDYYFNNLTLQEIAENNEISKNAVHKSIQDILKKLNYYEENLKLLENKNKIEELIKDLDPSIKDKIRELV